MAHTKHRKDHTKSIAQELPPHPLEALQVEGMSITPEKEWMIRDGKFHGTSVGATYDAVPFRGPDTCSICGVIWPTCEHAKEGKAHFEMGWHRDAEGKPVFDEISLCPGPDPNGITDLK